MIPISRLQLGDRTFKCSSVGKYIAFCWLRSWNGRASRYSFIYLFISNDLAGNLEKSGKKAWRLLFPRTCACLPWRGERWLIVRGLFLGSGDQSQLLCLWLQPAIEAGWQSLQHHSPCCWKKEQLCPPSQPRAPFLSFMPAIALTQPLASLGRKPVQQPVLENQSSSPQKTLVFNEIRCPKARLCFSAAFQLKSAQTGVETTCFSFFPAHFRDGETPLFHRALSC